MRYQEDQLGKIATVDPGTVLGTVIYTLLLGMFFIVFGLKVQKRWIVFWGGTMVIASGAYLVAVTVMSG